MTHAGSTTGSEELFSMMARLRRVLPRSTVVERSLREMDSESNRPIEGVAADSAWEATDGCAVDGAVVLLAVSDPSAEHADAVSSAVHAAKTNGFRIR
jgi:hypothetical protein